MKDIYNKVFIDNNNELIDFTNETIRRYGAIKHYNKGEFLFKEGDLPGYLYVVNTGLIKVSQSIGTGSDITFFLKTVNQGIGLSESLLGTKRLRYAQCLLESTVSAVSLVDLLILSRDPRFLHGLLLRVAKSYLQVQSNLAVYTHLSLRLRLAHLLKNMSSPDEHGILRIDVNFSHEELSNFIGSSRQKTTRQLNEWKQQGLITYSRKEILIFDIDALTEQ
ncbi:hypothetical protein BTJ39_12520 [Izhakiella australiensis]|uniref:Crp/Fnr family transcriptional regulator n=1 Tax=Izhakiella australiensis TaxID=1926881 RepID=A0A1S8YKU1_9GAMM|nr:Crp/Fnr family transcriptional regulator [Izhakiella australiensis]OON39477.1 hypothetical protein BTJ39_12520 [Izhakiella australiensis]